MFIDVKSDLLLQTYARNQAYSFEKRFKCRKNKFIIALRALKPSLLLRTTLNTRPILLKSVSKLVCNNRPSLVKRFEILL